MHLDKAFDEKEKPKQPFRTCFIGGGVCGHAPGAGPPTFGDHDGELVHGVWLQAYHGVAQSGRIC